MLFITHPFTHPLPRALQVVEVIAFGKPEGGAFVSA